MSEGARSSQSPQKLSRAPAKTGSASMAASQLFDDLMLSAWQSLPDATPKPQSPSTPVPSTAEEAENRAAAETIAKLAAAAPAVQQAKRQSSVNTTAPAAIPAAVPAASSRNSGRRDNAMSADDQILRQVADCLAERNIPSFARIGVDVKRGVITIRGDVFSKGERLLLLHLLQKIPGVVQVNDGLSITRAARSAPQGALITGRMSIPWPDLAGLVPRINPTLIAAAVLVIGSLAFWFWPRGTVRPVAVHPVKGRALLEGQPMPGASVVLHPSPNSQALVSLRPRGTVAEDGTFSLSTFDQSDGAPAGDFVVTVVWCKPVIVDGETQLGPNLASAAYAKPDSSPLRITITPDTNELPPLELKKLHSRTQPRPVPAYQPE